MLYMIKKVSRHEEFQVFLVYFSMHFLFGSQFSVDTAAKLFGSQFSVDAAAKFLTLGFSFLLY